MRIAIVDDHELLAQSLGLALEAEGFTTTVYRPDDLSALLAKLLLDAPDVVLLDLQLGRAGHGQCLITPLTHAGARVLVVSGVTDRCELAATVEAGAVGYVSKAEPIEELLTASARVARGESLVSREDRHQLLKELRLRRAETGAAAAMFDSLTAREREVLRGLTDGHHVTVIAERCFVSVATVRTQVRAILHKLGVGSQLEAVALAHRYGWYDRDTQS